MGKESTQKDPSFLQPRFLSSEVVVVVLLDGDYGLVFHSPGLILLGNGRSEVGAVMHLLLRISTEQVMRIVE